MAKIETNRMNFKSSLGAVLLCAVASAAAAQAQQPVLSTELKTNPAIALRDFEGGGNDAYELGRGDEISISFTGRPELNSKDIVGPDGKVTLPLAGSIMLADKTREQAAQAIETAMSGFYSNVAVTVGVDKYTSNQLLLLGAVARPGLVRFDRPPTLLEVITRGGTSEGGAAGSFTNAGAGGAYRLDAQALPGTIGVPERCAIYRGSNKVLWVDLKSLLDSGSPMADLRLKRDDIVYVPSASERYVSVLGEVTHPGALRLESGTTLVKLIALSGGLTADAGKYPDVQIIQPATGKTRTISFKQILQPQSLDLTIASGDIIYIPKSGLARMGYVVEKISPLVTLFTTAALITGR